MTDAHPALKIIFHNVYIVGSQVRNRDATQVCAEGTDD